MININKIAEEHVCKARQILYLVKTINFELNDDDINTIITAIKANNINMLKCWRKAKSPDLTVRELRIIASRNKIEDYNWMTKSELIDAINRKQESNLNRSAS